jgi:hypothetical protein
MQTDPESSIRTNTCILIGRLGPSLGYHTKRKVLVPAFTRALKDSFVHARVAGLMAFMATIDCFDADDVATKVIPNISSSLIDGEKYDLLSFDHRMFTDGYVLGWFAIKPLKPWSCLSKSSKYMLRRWFVTSDVSLQ